MPGGITAFLARIYLAEGGGVHVVKKDVYEVKRGVHITKPFFKVDQSTYKTLIDVNHPIHYQKPERQLQYHKVLVALLTLRLNSTLKSTPRMLNCTNNVQPSKSWTKMQEKDYNTGIKIETTLLVISQILLHRLMRSIQQSLNILRSWHHREP